MPKAKQKSKQVESQDDRPRASQSQGGSFTQAEKAFSNFNKQEVERRVNDLVQFMLIMDQKKLPIKKLDINKHVLKEMSRAFQVMIEKAKAKLSTVFGIELVELEEKQKGSYMLVNTIETDSDNPHLIWSPEDNAKTGLLMVILSLIFMNGNVISDGELWHTLKKLGVDIEFTHEVFGDVKKLVTTEFVRQGYVEYIRQPSTDPPTYEFRWGQRAKHESSKRNVLDFVCQIYEMEPRQWTSQWQDMVRSESMTNGDAKS